MKHITTDLSHLTIHDLAFIHKDAESEELNRPEISRRKNLRRKRFEKETHLRRGLRHAKYAGMTNNYTSKLTHVYDPGPMKWIDIRKKIKDMLAAEIVS